MRRRIPWANRLAPAVLAGLIFALGWGGGAGATTGPAVGTMRVGTTRMSVELPVEPDGLRRGLSERDSIARGTDGMYFRAFGLVGFGMDGMRFCLDFIWIDAGRVIGVTQNVCPDAPDGPPGPPSLYYPPGPITAAVETPAGWVAEHGVAAGDSVTSVTLSHRMVFGMVKKAAKDGRFDETEQAMVVGALSYAGVSGTPIFSRMDAAAVDGTISKRELRRIRIQVRRLFAAAPQDRAAPARDADSVSMR